VTRGTARAALSRVTAATFLVSGGQTSHVSRTRLERVGQQIRDCQFVAIPGAGHRVHSTHLGRFADAVCRS